LIMEWRLFLNLEVFNIAITATSVVDYGVAFFLILKFLTLLLRLLQLFLYPFFWGWTFVGAIWLAGAKYYVKESMNKDCMARLAKASVAESMAVDGMWEATQTHAVNLA
nr:hypothetical protein [Tanacetum cinerariifolium]